MLYRFLLSLGGLAVSAYCGLCLYLYAYQTRFIFKPSRDLEQTPEALQLDYEDIWLPVGAAGEIHGWWLPALTSAPQGRNRVLLYLHGNSHNIGGNLANAQRFQRLGFSVFLFDYRGYGLSPGPFPSEQQVYEDAATAWAYLTQTRRIPASEIVIYGHSLGGAIAIDLAVKQPEAAGLIVESSFSSMQAAANADGQYRLIPVNWLLTQRFDSLAKAPRLQMPVLYIHGLEDEMLPATMSQQLYAASPDRKALWLVPQAHHADVGDVAEASYLQVVRDFVADYLEAVPQAVGAAEGR
jgi:hypothetical protein